jgi:hypothetical protein
LGLFLFGVVAYGGLRVLMQRRLFLGAIQFRGKIESLNTLRKDEVTEKV